MREWAPCIGSAPELYSILCFVWECISLRCSFGQRTLRATDTLWLMDRSKWEKISCFLASCFWRFNWRDRAGDKAGENRSSSLAVLKLVRLARSVSLWVLYPHTYFRSNCSFYGSSCLGRAEIPFYRTFSMFCCAMTEKISQRVENEGIKLKSHWQCLDKPVIT